MVPGVLILMQVPLPFLCAVSLDLSKEQCAVCVLYSMHRKYGYISLQFCDWDSSSSYGAAQCRNLNGGCQGSGNTSCWPYVTWSSKVISTGYYYAHDLAGGIFYEAKPAGHSSSHAIGVRCVLGLSAHNKLQLKFFL